MSDEYKPDDYKSSSNEDGGAVVKDTAPIKDPIDANTADSDAQLARDDKDAIDTSNIIDEKTQGAKPAGGYQEPSDDPEA